MPTGLRFWFLRFSCFVVLYVLYDLRYFCTVVFSLSGFISWWFGVLTRPVFNFAQGNGFFVHCSGFCGGPRRPKRENPWKCDACFLFYFFPISTSFLHFFYNLDLSVRNFVISVNYLSNCQELLWIAAFDTSMQPPTCSTYGCAWSMPKLVNVQPFGGDTEKWQRIATTYGKELTTYEWFQ